MERNSAKIRSALTFRFYFALLAASTLGAQTDADRDGIDDALEQRLLVEFAPTLILSAQECDGLPAEFRADAARPEVVARNGTIYGRVSPHGPRTLEAHYYHLWSRDCGRFGHDLDVEHVSALLTENDGRWRADSWYAAAHENTVCDASSIAPARALDARDKGPRIWVSRGKHASFFSKGACQWGCGGDVCDRGQHFRPVQIVNLGEAGAPLNGATWADSSQWPLAVKFRSDFTPERLALVSNSRGPAAVNAHLRPAQSIVLAGDSTADALELSGAKTDSALNRAADETGGALDTAASATGKALGKAYSNTRKFLGFKDKGQKPPN
ncbi:MAG: hypothetical protein SFV18_00055 [Bryobacteraceae bacterium]|nr:hypothetical protein [Bryobacteraceae bacterium]